jgi:cytosine/adenosine deaminase-related metal-dependent hydrolase
MSEYLTPQMIPLQDNFRLFEDLYSEYNHQERIRIQLTASNLHWCSDEALNMVKDYADKYQVPVHMHLLETAYQKEYARRRTNGTAVQHLSNLGFLGPHLTMGHCVWITEADIDLIAETSTKVCHNASSNLRLRSGVAPLNRLKERDVHVAIGIDGEGLDDSQDMFKEMRLVLNLHRVPGMDEPVPTASQVFRMATEHGAHTTPYGATIGTLEPGKSADMVVMNWKRIAYPYLDPDLPVLDALVMFARSTDIETVLVGGEPILHDGRFTRLNKDEVMEELAASLRVPLSSSEERRRELSRQVFPYVKEFYHDYLADQDPDPFYRQNSKK